MSSNLNLRNVVVTTRAMDGMSLFSVPDDSHAVVVSVNSRTGHVEITFSNAGIDDAAQIMQFAADELYEIRRHR